MTSHVLLTTFCIIAFSSGTFVFLKIYFASFLLKLQALIDSNRGQIPKGQLLSSLEVAREYTHGMDIFLLSGAVLSILAAFAVGAVMANRLSRPLRVFTTAIKSLKSNDHARIDLPLTAELSDLQNAFNDLSASLKSLQEMRKVLIANVSHELKTPLTALQGYVEGLEDGVIPFDPQVAAEIGTEIDRLKNLVKELEISATDFSKLVRPVSVDVHEFFRELRNYYSNLLSERKLEMRVSGPDAPLRFMFDPDRMKQVFINLIDNAMKYTPDSGSISITYLSKEGRLQILVQDTGCGIPNSDLPFIFERFYRGDRSRSRKTGGAGIGLSIVKEIVLAHHGTIVVDSRPGEGTQFLIDLPGGSG